MLSCVLSEKILELQKRGNILLVKSIKKLNKELVNAPLKSNFMDKKKLSN